LTRDDIARLAASEDALDQFLALAFKSAAVREMLAEIREENGGEG
jgi:hypothetical protein